MREKLKTYCVFHFMSCLHSQFPPGWAVVFVLQIRFTSNLKMGSQLNLEHTDINEKKNL